VTATSSTDGLGPLDPATQAPPALSNHLDGILQKIKLLEFGLYGLQQYGRNAPLDVEDIGPFYRLAEEIESDVLAIRERLTACPATGRAA
jgi:hypothetical protein